MAAYSFKDVVATISGPNGIVVIGSDAGSEDEGLSIVRTGDKNEMKTGADGQGMHSLHAENSGVITVRLLKTSPINAALQQMYDADKASSIVWGKNTIVVADIARGDLGDCDQVAFKKFPDEHWGRDGQVMEWTFDAIEIDQILGAGQPDLGG